MKKLFDLIRHYAVFIISFVFTKGVVYIVPLLLADILSTKDFGMLEYALAGLGFVVNALINLGIPGGYPYFVLRLKKLAITNGFDFHPLWLLFLFILNQFGYFFLNLKPELYLAFNTSYIIANQVFYSTQLKSHEYPTKAIYLDSGIYIVLLLAIVCFKFNIIDVSIHGINNIIFIYALIYAFVGVVKYIKVKKKNIFYNYKLILQYSLNVMIGSFLIFLITSSGRILAEAFFTFDEVAIYGFYFRLSAVVVMIYQMINIIYFKKIYILNPKILDKYYSLFFILMGILSFVIFLVAPLVLNNLSIFFRESYEDNRTIYFLLSGQMLMWIATALNSNIIDRENLMKMNNVWLLVLVFFSGMLLLSFGRKLSLESMVFIHYTIIYLACMIQYYSLSTKKIMFKKSVLTLSVSYILVMLYFSFF